MDGSHLARALHQLSFRPEVVTLIPHTLDEVLADVERVGDATSRAAEARALIASLKDRIAQVREQPKRQKLRVACLEWLTPPFNGGHWIPEMVALAGGIDPLGALGGYSTRMRWQQVLDAAPEVVLVMPCGYSAAQAAEEYRRTELPPGWRDLPAVQSGRVYAVDANAYFSRPGPRLIDGLEIMHALLQDGPLDHLPARSWLRLEPIPAEHRVYAFHSKFPEPVVR